MKKNLWFYILFALIILAILSLLIFYPRPTKLKNQSLYDSSLNPIATSGNDFDSDNTISSSTDNNLASNTESAAPVKVYMPATTSLDVSPTSIANPASINCEKVGGNLVMQKDGSGGEYGLCYFEDNYACEEWALWRGDCPVGGLRTTGYDTEEQKYCAWLGGQTYAVENAVCKFKDGSSCPDADLFKGLCRAGQNK